MRVLFALCIAAASGEWTPLGGDLPGEVAGDLQGRSVALNKAGDVLAVGACCLREFGSETRGQRPGTARTYRLADGDWAKFGGDVVGTGLGDEHGTDVALNGRGDVLAVGAPGVDSVRVYEDAGAGRAWTQREDDVTQKTRFGTTVSLREDGLVLAASEPYNTIAGEAFAYSFDRTDSVFELLGQKLDDQNPRTELHGAVALNAAGNILVAGAPRESRGGAVLAYKLASKNNGRKREWRQLGEKLFSPSRESKSLFGLTVDISAAGDRIAVGAPFEDVPDDSKSQRGVVRVFDLDDNSEWKQVGGDIVGDLDYGLAGASLSLSGDGRLVAVGAPTDHSGIGDEWDVVRKSKDDSGTVRVFALDGNDLCGNEPQASRADLFGCHAGDDWVQTGQTLTGEAEDDKSERRENERRRVDAAAATRIVYPRRFGASVTLSFDGRRLAVGAPETDPDELGRPKGRVAVYQFEASEEASEETSEGSDPASEETPDGTSEGSDPASEETPDGTSEGSDPASEETPDGTSEETPGGAPEDSSTDDATPRPTFKFSSAPTATPYPTDVDKKNSDAAPVTAPRVAAALLAVAAAAFA